MTPPPAIYLDGVSKKFRFFASPAQRLQEALHPFRRRFHEEFWALRNVGFTLAPGRTLGVLGLNGSGKSTLLKVIADVLEPTEGRVQVNGRIAALLELGAGFNPDLTGRDNVLTNASILGLDRRQAQARLGEVESFADIGRHFDQPMRTLSSGSFMRVAFALAICVDPDILIIDEALAVGDAKFQEKCFRRLRDFQAQGGTMLFVSHDRASVTQLCDEAILLHEGRLIAQGGTDAVVATYTELLTTGRLPEGSWARATPAQVETAQSVPQSDGALGRFLADTSMEDRLAAHPLHNANERRFGAGGAAILDSMIVVDGAINPERVIAGTEADLYLRIRFDTTMAPLVGITLHTARGVEIYSTHSGWLGHALRPATPGELRCFRFRARLPVLPGPLFLELAVASADGRICDQRSRAMLIDIVRDRMFLGLADLGFGFEEVTRSAVEMGTGPAMLDRRLGAAGARDVQGDEEP